MVKAVGRVKGFGMHLYGAEKLAVDKRDILLVEGEKTAEAAQKIFPEYAVVAIAGTNKIDQSDILPPLNI